MPWTLDDAEALNREHPRSFFIPPRKVRESLVRGDEVKLLFRLEREDGEVAVERIWVEVTAADPLEGRLRNEPRLTGVIAYDDPVAFEPRHVAAYAYADLGYEATAPVVVSRAIVEDDVAPDRLHLDGERGWLATVGDEPPVHTWTLGYLADRFPETEPALREGSRPDGPREVAWLRRGEAYVRA